jgi:CelD/BcsL family acetyltransferase involved in cellulose biosynthesis
MIDASAQATANNQTREDILGPHRNAAHDAYWNIEFLSRDGEATWNDYVRMHQKANIFHTLEWRHVLESSFGYRTMYLLCKDSKGRIGAVLPLAYVNSFLTGRRLVSIPFSQYCGPLWTDDDALTYILSCLDNIRTATRSDYVLLKMKEQLPERVRNTFNFTQTNYFYQSNIPLEGTKEEIWRRLHKRSIRHAVTRAQRWGVRVEKSTDIDDIEHLCDLMLKTSRRHGTPSYPPKLFVEIYESLMPKGLAEVFFATYMNKAIGVLVLFRFNGAMSGYNFSDMDFRDKQPNALLFWHAIELSYDAGYKNFDMGISSPYHLELLDWKRKWGGETVPTPYYLLSDTGRKEISLDSTSPFFNACGNILRAVPLPVFSKIGPRLMGHFG